MISTFLFSTCGRYMSVRELDIIVIVTAFIRNSSKVSKFSFFNKTQLPETSLTVSHRNNLFQNTAKQRVEACMMKFRRRMVRGVLQTLSAYMMKFSYVFFPAFFYFFFRIFTKVIFVLIVTSYNYK